MSKHSIACNCYYRLFFFTQLSYITFVYYTLLQDYKGQKDAEDLFQYIITAFSVAGFFYG